MKTFYKLGVFLLYVAAFVGNSNSVVAQQLTGGGGSGAVSAPISFVATNSVIPTSLSTTTAKQWNCSTIHRATDNISAIQVRYSNTTVTGTGEAGTGGTMTLALGIEYPIGTTPQQIKFGGVSPGVSADNTDLLSDMTPLAVTIPNGAFFKLHPYVTGSVGVAYQSYSGLTPVANSGEACEYAASGLTDKSLSNAAITPTLATSRNTFQPVGIYGATNNRTFAIIGDSICLGQNDWPRARNDGVGILHRTINKQYGNVLMCVGGDSANSATTSYSHRAVWGSYATAIASNYGINDTRGGRTPTQIFTDYNTLWGFLGNKPWYQTTISNNTDAANLTPNGVSEAQRPGLNAAIRANSTPITQHFDTDAIFATRQDSGIWRTDETRTFYDCSTTASSVSLTCPSARFSLADQGKGVNCIGAGASGAIYYGEIRTYVTTTNVSMDTAPATTVTGTAICTIGINTFDGLHPTEDAYRKIENIGVIDLSPKLPNPNVQIQQLTTQKVNFAGAPPGLIMWQDFTEYGGPVAYDKTGNGNNCTLAASPNTPTWKSPGLFFASSAQVSTGTWCQYPTTSKASLTGALTHVFIICQDAQTITTSGGWNNTGLLVSSAAAGLQLQLFGQNGNAVGFWWPGMGTNTSYNRSVANVRNIIGGCKSVIYEAAATDRMFVNGMEVDGYVAQGNSSAAPAASTLLQLGGGSTVSSNYFWGTVYHHSAYNRLLSNAPTAPGQPTEVMEAHNIAWSDAVKNGAPLNPVYPARVQDTMICIGDSITYGQGLATPATQNFCNLAMASGALGSPTVVNLGVSGMTMVAMSSRIEAAIAPYLSKGRVSVSLLGCTNDMAAGGVATVPATCANFIRATSAAAQKMGAKLFVGTSISRGAGTGAATDTEVQALNTLLLAGGRTYGDMIVHYAGNAFLGATGANANTTYFNGDKIHPILAGDTLMANILRNAYNWFWSNTEGNVTTYTAATVSLLNTDVRVFLDSTSNAIAATLPDCTGYTAEDFFEIQVGTAANAVTLKDFATAQTIDGVDRSTTGLTLAANSKTRFRPYPGPVAAGGCFWRSGF